jgi:hypothetical protein
MSKPFEYKVVAVKWSDRNPIASETQTYLDWGKEGWVKWSDRNPLASETQTYLDWGKEGWECFHVERNWESMITIFTFKRS